jgi:hypothetical protein
MAITPQIARWQFVLRFSQIDLATLESDARYALQDELVAFLTLGTAQRLEDPQTRGGVPIPLYRNVQQGLVLEAASWVCADLRHATCAIVREEDFPLPDATVRLLQDASRQMLDDAGTPRVFPLRWAPRLEGPVELIHRALDTEAPAGGGLVRYLMASPRDAFLFVLSEMLTYETTLDRMQRCPVCRARFYRVGKQKNCSVACTNRAGVRQWRQRQEVKSAEADRAHDRYAQTTKTAVGAGVNVRRRPRKAGP